MPALCAPIDLTSVLNAGRTAAPGVWQPLLESALHELPGGEQRYWGVPFQLAPEGDGPAWLLLDESRSVSLGGDAGDRSPTYVVFVHTCGLPESVGRSTLPDPLVHAGESVAEYVFSYADGSEHRQPIRWRFETNGGPATFGLRAFAARPNRMDGPLDFRGPYERNTWGRAQTSVEASSGRYWVYALPNPHPEKRATALGLEPAPGSSAVLAIAAATQFFGQDHPLRHRQLETFRAVRAPDEWRRHPGTPSIDLGVVARKYAVPAFDPDGWLAGEGITQPLQGEVSSDGLSELFLDIAASADATLTLGEHDVPLRRAYEGETAASSDGAVQVEIISPSCTWLHVTLEDGSPKPAAAGVHFRDRHGRYLPPYGFRHQVNDNWFEDYGADVKLHGAEYAYVDGRFQMEAPV